MISMLFKMELKKLVVQKEMYIILAICTLMIWLSQQADMLRDTQPYRFSKSLLDFMPWIGYLLLLFPIIVATARIVPFEHEQKMTELLATYKYGRKSLILVKLAVLFCICAFTILYFFIIAGTINYFLYGFDDWMLTTNSIDFIYLDMFLEGGWFVWQVLVFEYIYLLLSTFTFALSLFLVTRFIRRSVFIMLTGGAVFLLVELLDKFVMSFVNQMKISEYINIMIRYSFNSLVNFELLELFSFPQLFNGLIISMLILIIVNILIEGKAVHD